MKHLLRMTLMAGLFQTVIANAETRAESVSDNIASDSQAVLDNEDPFAILGGTSSGGETAPVKTRGIESAKSGRIKTEGSVYIRNIQSNVNSDSHINPGNRVLLLEENRTLLETRLTLSDNFDVARQWRWLFRGFGSLSSEREPNDGLRDAFRFDEAFVDWKGERWFASLGKRRINWGHAQGFNPVNVVVPPRDPLDPSRETEGQPMLWTSRIDGAWAVDMVLTRNYDRVYASDRNRWGLKWNFAGKKSDYALYYFDGERYRDGRDYERMWGGSFSANLVPGMTLYAEAARFEKNYRHYYNASGALASKDDSYWQAVIGTGLNLGGRRQVTVEYYSNTQGFSTGERLNYFRAAEGRIAAGDMSIASEYRVTGMNRDYVLLGYQDEIRERFMLDMSALIPGDRSYSLRVQGKYAASDFYELRLVLLHNQGSRDSEFGNSPVSNAVELGLSVGF